MKVKCDALNIRKGPGTAYAVVGCIRDRGTYTIVETSDNWGASQVGRRMDLPGLHLAKGFGQGFRYQDGGHRRACPRGHPGRLRKRGRAQAPPRLQLRGGAEARERDAEVSMEPVMIQNLPEDAGIVARLADELSWALADALAVLLCALLCPLILLLWFSRRYG